ncbi:PREDICTED: probable G-protein coupled receptor 157 [Amphimedon queenslandica]|uniref:G-protein coupled receptors family 1 profile domain-containing protein n=1 Tax=Amphimedon queenslandica TaxID=400682 RepID=A0A1X7UQ88_AMPQE|nr:PREDICTED: probable G-protein coupled receptor 157 [Amphimedon queenslandica]|eukprot:XP_011404330.1 PREDICTED: probable G-protein coupled receptor 157 [Amphimedon queenslandica]
MVYESLLSGVNCSHTNDNYLLQRYSVRITVATTCFLSMIGATLVMLSFICFKTMRSPTRLILFNIAIMDFLVAFSNFFGDVGNFESYYINTTALHSACLKDGVYPSEDMLQTPPSYINSMCISQAFLAMYSTLSSVLWTSGLAVYLYFSISHSGTRKGLFSLAISFIISYVMPLGICLWALLTHKLGYSPYNAASWCALIIYNPDTNTVDKYVAIFGYNLWIYLTIVLTVVIYIGLRLYLADQEKKTSQFVTQKKFWDSVHNMDYKFMLIPVFFILLRIWSCISDIMMFADVDMDDIPSGVTLTLLILSGIGDSGQGLINGLLFVVLTKTVRQHMLNAFTCRWRKISFTFRNSQVQSAESPRAFSDERTPFWSSYEEINYS